MLRGFTADSFGNNVRFHTRKCFTSTLPDSGKMFREGQLQMAMDILDTFSDDTNIRVIEAGVGIGKSYAYLVPALLAKKHAPDLSLIISTGTISLQEQLIKDIETLCKLLKLPSMVTGVLAKGQTHFLCKKRATRVFRESSLPPWLTDTKLWSPYGDRKEIEKRAQNVFKDEDWDRINVDRSCNKQECQFYRSCGYMKLRTMMKEPRKIIVTNHDQLIQDRKLISQDKSSLFHINMFGRPVRDILILDEAHMIEAKARSAEQVSYSLDNMHSDVTWAASSLHLLSTYREIQELEKKIRALITGLYSAVFKRCIQMSSVDTQGEFPERFNIILPDFTNDLLSALKELNTKLQIHASKRFEDRSPELAQLIDFLSDLSNSHQSKTLDETNTETVFTDDPSDFIYWAELKKKDRKTLSLNRIPKEMSRIVEDALFASRTTKFILTSATLTDVGETLEERYAYFMDSIGVRLSNTNLSEPQPSPYNYAAHTLLYLPPGLPSVVNERAIFREQGSIVIEQLLGLTQGRALILFTAKEDLQAVKTLLQKRNLPWKLLVQDKGGSQDALMEQFIQDEHSILLSTSFWEGINVEGTALSNLIIFKLPYPVREPILNYKVSQMGDTMAVYLPEMLTRLRQGLGRLIRSEMDTGIVTILDSRMNSKKRYPYREQILQAIPFTSVTESMDEVAHFVYSKLGFQNVDPVPLDHATVDT